MNRKQKFEYLNKNKVFDFIIVGGGATGLGCALDASSRGYSVALFEKHDFCKGTSSRSTKLIHGGVRYLEKFQFKLVYEALKERDFLMKNASHVTNKIGFVIPVYKPLLKFYYWFGLKLYDLISGDSFFPKSKIINKKKVQELLPNINNKGLLGGVCFFDGQFNDSRLGIDIGLTAEKFGATLFNYTSVESFIKHNDIIKGVNVRDSVSNNIYEVKSKIVINCTGVFSQSIINLDYETSKNIIKPSQGTHLVIEKRFLKSDFGFLIPKTPDGRVLFAIPWHNSVILGTTDNEINEPEIDPKPKLSEINYILKNVKQYFKEKPDKIDIKTIYTGLRPLVSDSSNSKSKDLSRKHKIFTSKSGLISVVGGKWTTYRKISEKTVDIALKNSDLKFLKSKTRKIKIFNGLSIIKNDKSISKKIDLSPSSIVHFVRNEMAINLDDIMSRRSRCLFLDVDESLRLAPKVVKIMAEELQKDEKWQNEQLKSFIELTKLYKI